MYLFIRLHRVLLASRGILCREAEALECAGSVVVAHGLSYSATCGTLVPWPGIEPASPALQGGFLTTGPLGKFLDSSWVDVSLQSSPIPLPSHFPAVSTWPPGGPTWEQWRRFLLAQRIHLLEGCWGPSCSVPGCHGLEAMVASFYLSTCLAERPWCGSRPCLIYRYMEMDILFFFIMVMSFKFLFTWFMCLSLSFMSIWDDLKNELKVPSILFWAVNISFYCKPIKNGKLV